MLKTPNTSAKFNVDIVSSLYGCIKESSLQKNPRSNGSTARNRIKAKTAAERKLFCISINYVNKIYFTHVLGPK